ncbi:hypothetical protein FOL47_003436 [Perkinsus chesapeaki]|uniref:Uncharacterized protein n=1 Tax=Perkinsus chesapeaki TaxID=330153 RepID=A0A7J6M7W4_PERCH|nr:hypothetical protein FOL47_003436 [Perkinsus chesapeaki]
MASSSVSILLKHQKQPTRPKVIIEPPVTKVEIRTMEEAMWEGMDDIEYLLFNSRTVTPDRSSSEGVKPAYLDLEGMLYGAMKWSDYERDKVLPRLCKEEYKVSSNTGIDVTVTIRTLCLSSHVCPDKASRKVAGGKGPESQKLYRFESRPCILMLHDLGEGRASWLQWMRLAVDIFKDGIFDIIMCEVDLWRKDPSPWFAHFPVILPEILGHLEIDKIHVLADGFGSGCFIRCLTEWRIRNDQTALRRFSGTTHLLHNCDYAPAVHLEEGKLSEILRRAVEESRMQLWLTWQDSVIPSKVTRTRKSVRNRMTLLHGAFEELAKELQAQRRILGMDFDLIISSELPYSVMSTELVGSSAKNIAKTNLVNLIANEDFTDSVKTYFGEGEKCGLRLIRECFKEDLFIDLDIFGALNRIINEVPEGGAVLPALMTEEERRKRFPPKEESVALVLENEAKEAAAMMRKMAKNKAVELALSGLSEDYEGERSLIKKVLADSIETADHEERIRLRRATTKSLMDDKIDSIR